MVIPRATDRSPASRGRGTRDRTVVDGALALSHRQPSDVLTRTLKTSETVARDIVHDIVSRGLQEGDHLLSEAAMLELYGVSRESLREGLRLLEVQGLITIRRGPGGGPIVGRVDPANLGRVSTLYYHLAGGTYAELFDAWLVTEVLLAERAAANEDREAVRAAMAPFTSLPEAPPDPSDFAEFVLSHTQFHVVVAELAKNRVLELMLQTVGRIVTHHIVGTADPREVQQQIEKDHVAMARAISAGQVTRAGSLAEKHILFLTAYYREQIGTRMEDFIEWR